MTQKETTEYIKDMKKFIKRISSSVNKSKEFLVETGIYTNKGNLKKPYK